MSAGVILIKSFVADYCSNSNRRQEKIMPETVFYFTQGHFLTGIITGGACGCDDNWVLHLRTGC